MVSMLAQFFGIVGIDMQPPVSFATALPWLLQVFIGIGIIVTILRFFFAVARSVFGGRWLQ